jgi:membrane protein required for colicin V production
MILDIIAGLIMLASVLIAILRGFIREVLTIFGLVGGAVAAYIGGPLLSPYYQSWMGVTEGQDEPEKLLDMVPYPLVAEVLAYATVFIVFVILLSILSHFLAESVKSLGLGAVDRTLGMVFGIVRGVLFLGLLYLPIYYLAGDEQKEDWSFLQDSKSRVYLEATSEWIAGFIPVNEEDINFEETSETANAVNDARKKLEDMNLLQKSDSELQDPEDQKQKDGYTDESRSEMDKLIEDVSTAEEDGNKTLYNE